MQNSSFNTKLFLNDENSITVFFKSIIGPRSKNDITAPSPKLSKKVLATNASASEHSDDKNANPIIINIEKGTL